MSHRLARDVDEPSQCLLRGDVEDARALLVVSPLGGPGASGLLCASSSCQGSGVDPGHPGKPVSTGLSCWMEGHGAEASLLARATRGRAGAAGWPGLLRGQGLPTEAGRTGTPWGSHRQIPLLPPESRWQEGPAAPKAGCKGACWPLPAPRHSRPGQPRIPCLGDSSVQAASVSQALPSALL